MSSHPVQEPFDAGLLDVGDGHRIYWQASGNRSGKPAVLLHGGPGAPMASRAGRMFRDPRVFMVHGQLDISGPLDVPWSLARATPTPRSSWSTTRATAPRGR